MERFLIALGVFATLSTTAYAQISQLEYDQLPKEIRDEVDETRAACKKLGAEDDPYFGSGLQIIDLDGKGSRDILLDYQHVCNGWFKGGNCSNRGCDLRIWKQTGRNSWRKIFDEHLWGTEKFISIGRDNRRFGLMAVSIYAGNPHCKPIPGRNYASGEWCDALVFYRNGTWVWQKIQ